MASCSGWMKIALAVLGCTCLYPDIVGCLRLSGLYCAVLGCTEADIELVPFYQSLVPFN